MRRYECIYILKPDLSPEQIDDLCKRFTDIISDNDGTLILEDRWGLKTLAYEVKKYSKGYYVLLDYAAEKNVTAELERNFKMLENVIRFLTVLTEEQITPEQLQALLSSEKKRGVQAESASEEEEGKEEEKEEGEEKGVRQSVDDEADDASSDDDE
jgi:small subunit ribosomal protein S6